MLHACLVSTFLCFVYTLRCFYTFSRTNLLTICRNASCLFSAVFGFIKSSKEIFSELDGTKAKVNISPRIIWSTEEKQRGATGWPHPRAVRPRHGPRCHQVWAPWLPSCLASSPIKAPRCQNPKHPIRSPQNSPYPPPQLSQDQGRSEALPGTMPEGRVHPGGLLH